LIVMSRGEPVGGVLPRRLPGGNDWRYGPLAGSDPLGQAPSMAPSSPPSNPTSPSTNPFSTTNTVTPLTGGNRDNSAMSEGGFLLGERRQQSRAAGDNIDDYLPPLRTNKVGWLAPVGLLLVALFLQSAGLYHGTQCYVRWMDEIGDPIAPDEPSRQHTGQRVDGGGSGSHSDSDKHGNHVALHPANALQSALTLRDPIGEYIRSLQLDLVSGPWGAEFWVDLMSCLVFLMWSCWVARTKDLRLWTKVLVAAAILACTKGFLAWSMVLPDAAGWDRCRKRLSPDGLMYYRELSARSASGDGVSAFQAFFDICLLELQSLWMVGRSGHEEICADTIISSPTCFGALLAAALYDAVRAHTEQVLDASVRATRLALLGSFLALVLLADFFLTVATARHYTMNITVAIPFTLMLYGSPALAALAERWVAMSEIYDDPEELAIRRGGSDAKAVKDLGQVTLPPCITPLCSLGSIYYLRETPGVQQRHPWHKEDQQRQREEFTKKRQWYADRMRTVGDQLDVARRDAQQKSAEAQAAEQRAAQQKDAKERRLRQEEERFRAEVTRKVEEQRQDTAACEEQADTEQRRIAKVDSEFREKTSRMQGDLLAARNEALEAQNAMLVHAAGAQRHMEEAAELRVLLGKLRTELGDGSVVLGVAEKCA